MTDEQMQSLLEEGFEAMNTAPEDVERSTRRVMEQKAHVRQRSRWWPFPVFYRRTQTTTASDTTKYQPSPVPATNGHTPTVIGRTQSMLSPAKAITAGALVFAIGGAFLIAQPFQQQGTVPGAEAEDVAPTWVTGDIELISDGTCTGPQHVERDGSVTHSWNYVCSPQVWTASDPRLSGEVASVWNDDAYRTDDGERVVNMSALYLENDGGGWTCSSPNLLERGGFRPAGFTGATYTCVGDGGYAGLSAILVLDGAKGYSEDFVGLVIPGDFPPLPEAPATE